MASSTAPAEVQQQPQSTQLAVSLANLAAVDAATQHCLSLAADTADTLAAGAHKHADELAALASEYARTVHTLGTLLHDEVDKAGGAVALGAAHIVLGEGAVPSKDRIAEVGVGAGKEP